MYTGPDPQFLAAAWSLEIGQECPVFRRADLATLLITHLTGSSVNNSMTTLADKDIVFIS